MKIAYCIRKNWKTAHGGDVVQMLNTKAEIERAYNVEIKVVDNVRELNSFNPDIVHIFNMQTIEESSEYLKEAKSLGAKTILSTIYWNMSHARFIVNFAKRGLFCTGENYKSLYHLYKNTESIVAAMFGKPRSATEKYKDQVRAFLQEFDWYLPNSEEEMQIVNNVFNTSYKNYSVIPNGVDFTKFPFFFNADRGGFISAARIEPIKNQLQIVDICKDSNFNLSIVGASSPETINYLQAINKKKSDAYNIQLINQNVSQIELRRLFNSHKVHILASFRESPGLSSLEALGSGMNIVVCESDYCPIETYFNKLINKHVFICDPYSRKSIKKAMEGAHAFSNPQENLIIDLNWSNAGILTYRAYEKIIINNSIDV